MKLQGTVSALAAAALSGNVLAGRQIELPERWSRIRVWAAASQVGGKCTVLAGTETLMEESDVSQANRFPIEPDDRVIEEVVAPGKRLNLSFRNSAGTATTFYWSIESIPVA